MSVIINVRKIPSVKHKHLAQRHDYVAIIHFAIPAVWEVGKSWTIVQNSEDN